MAEGSIKLQYPIEVNGVKTTDLEIKRRGNYGDIEAIAPYMGPPKEKETEYQLKMGRILAQRLTGITEEEFQQIDMDDIQIVMDAMDPFLPTSETGPRTRKKSPRK